MRPSLYNVLPIVRAQSIRRRGGRSPWFRNSLLFVISLATLLDAATSPRLVAARLTMNCCRVSVLGDREHE